MAEARTVFQTVESKLDTWEANGKQGPAPARPVFRSKRFGISAYVDPFRKLPGTVVVVPHEATPGEDAYVQELPVSRRAQLSVVTQAIGAKMLAHTGLRAVEHTEDYGVPDHAHIVLFPAERGKGRQLYEKVDLPPKEALDAELDTTQQLYSLDGNDLTVVNLQLQAIETIAPLVDDRDLPGLDAPRVDGLSHLLDATRNNIAEVTGRIILCT